MAEPLRVFSASEQVARHLKECLLRGDWSETMPGEDFLVAELGVGRDTVKMALRHLEREGFLKTQGKGHRRLITLPTSASPPKTQIGIIPHDIENWTHPFVMDLEKSITNAGLSIRRAPKGLVDLDMKVHKVAKVVEGMKVEGWIVLAGSREVLEWFAEREEPVCAIYGAFHNLPLAGIGWQKEGAYREIVRKLVALGHRRIVLLTRKDRRVPQPRFAEQAFLDELVSCGICPGPYHLPDWEDHPDGFREGLDKLFRLTPPTAMIFQISTLYIAAMQHLLRRGVDVPGSVSMVCDDYDASFEWCSPPISHLAIDTEAVLRSLSRWARNVAQGQKDCHQKLYKPKIIEGCTIGPAPSS